MAERAFVCGGTPNASDREEIRQFAAALARPDTGRALVEIMAADGDQDAIAALAAKETP